jgi:hypothetical protein
MIELVMRSLIVTLVLALGACSAPQATPSPSASSSSAAAGAAATSASASASEPPAEKTAIAVHEAEEVLFLGRQPAGVTRCRDLGDAEAGVRCLLGIAYDGDERARALVLALYQEDGIVTGVEPRQTMDGGWRGQLELVPELPVGRYRRHLEYLLPAYRDFRSFFAKLAERAKSPIAYRHQPIRLRFFRSVGRTTPSAYASGWSVAYNVSGSLHTSADAVRETMFHETFHLNDTAHEMWSREALTVHYEAVLERCTRGGKLQTPCLTPYAPNETMVRNGTYYAFQPGNGVWEYAAELAIRYYREHRRVFAGQKLDKKAFKCGPAPNAEAWRLIADEFFGGVDEIPPC